MSPVVVLMLVVSCTSDLLSCEEVSPQTGVWDTMPACEADRKRIEGEVARNDASIGQVIMTNCHYVLDETGAYRRQLAQRSAPTS